MRWQPIETAPKDGTRILVPYPIFDPGNLTASPDRYEIIVVHWREVGWVSDGAWMLHEDPTHWMPLPPPPHTEG